MNNWDSYSPFTKTAVWAILLGLLIYGLSSCRRYPADYKSDWATGTATWTDSEGRTLMQDRNGNVRELSRVKE